MGVLLFDQYTYLHFAVGVVAYYWGISLKNWFVIHIMFELLENTKTGVGFINKFSYWPGGKNYADTSINMLGDTIGAVLGWMSALLIDEIGRRSKYFQTHLVNKK